MPALPAGGGGGGTFNLNDRASVAPCMLLFTDGQNVSRDRDLRDGPGPGGGGAPPPSGSDGPIHLSISYRRRAAHEPEHVIVGRCSTADTDLRYFQ